MKRSKFSVTIIAVVLALTTVFATEANKSTRTVFQWHQYSGSVTNPIVTIVSATDEEAQASCPGELFKCMVRLDNNGVETTPSYKRDE